MDFRTQWGRNIAEARHKLGISQTELGERIPLRNKHSFNTVSRWERGVAIPDDRHRVRLAEILGVPVARLFPYPDLTNGDSGDTEAA